LLTLQATNGTRNLDDLVLELYRRYTAQEQVQTAEFLSVLGGLIGGLIGNETAEESLSGMLHGALIVPPADCFAEFGLGLVRRDAERFDLGFVTSQGKVSAFTADRTRAQAAGLRVGDDIVRMWGPWGASDSLDNVIRVFVNRDGRELAFEYWPRSYNKVENWEWVDVSVADG
jgi:predicted metalloprotease with PDZ domain